MRSWPEQLAPCQAQEMVTCWVCRSMAFEGLLNRKRIGIRGNGQIKANFVDLEQENIILFGCFELVLRVEQTVSSPSR